MSNVNRRNIGPLSSYALLSAQQEFTCIQLISYFSISKVCVIKRTICYRKFGWFGSNSALRAVSYIILFFVGTKINASLNDSFARQVANFNHMESNPIHSQGRQVKFQKKSNGMDLLKVLSGIDLINLAIEAWTHIDIVRAIYTTESQREHLLDNVVDCLLNLYIEVKKTVRSSVLNKDEVKMLHDICIDIKENYDEMFVTSMQSFIVGASVLCVLPKIINSNVIKTP